MADNNPFAFFDDRIAAQVSGDDEEASSDLSGVSDKAPIPVLAQKGWADSMRKTDEAVVKAMPYMFRKTVETANPVSMAKKAGSAAYLGLQGATFGGLDNVLANMRGVGNQLAHAGEALQGDFSAFDEGKREANITLGKLEEAARDELGAVGAAAAEMAGGIPRRTGPGMVASAVGLDNARDPGIWGLLNRSLKAGGAGAAEGMAVGAFDTFNPTDLAMYGVTGALVGTAAQPILGELAPTLAKYGLQRGSRTDTKIGNALLGTGMGGLTPEDIRANYDKAKRTNTSVFNYGEDEVASYVAVDRIADTVAKTTFPSSIAELGEQPKELIDDYAKTLSQINAELSRTNDEINQAVATRLENPVSTYAIRRNPLEDQHEAKTIYNSMTSTEPGSIGSMPVKFRDIEGELAKAVSKEMGIEDVTQLGSYSPIYNEILNNMRPLIQNSHARTLKRGQHYSPNAGEAQPPGTLNLDTATIPLAYVADAAIQIGQKVRPGMMLNTGSITPSDAAAAIKMRNAMYDVLAEHVPGSKEARATFAKSLAARDAIQMGAEFVDRGFTEDPDYGQNLYEFIEGMSKTDPQLGEMVKYGYRQKLRQKIETEGAIQTLTNLVGPLPKEGFDPSEATAGRKEGYRNLMAVLGRPEAKALIDEVTNKSHLAGQQRRLSDILEIKGFSPEAMEGVLRDGDNVILAASLAPGNQSITSTGAMGAMLRVAEQLGPKEGKRLIELLSSTGAKQANIMEEILRNTEIRRSFGVGDRAAVAVTDSMYGENEDYEQSKKDERLKNMALITDYLTSLGQ